MLDNNDLVVIELLKNTLVPGNVLVDVGANYGEYTNFFKNILKETGKIYCIELDPETFNHLENKFKQDKNIILVNKAISDKNSIIDYYKGNDAWTNNIIGHDTSYNKNNKKGTIESITLDELLKDEKHIDFIKIDVEGADLLVLSGMTETIKKTKAFLLECHFDNEWNTIKNILITEHKLNCYDLIKNQKVTLDSERAYQCLCVGENN